MPRVLLDSSMPVQSGGTIRNVEAGQDLQGVFNAAIPGDTIVLRAGAVFTGHFIIPTKAQNGKWLIVTTSNGLPAPGSRVGPANAVNMPKIVTPDNAPPLVFVDGSNFTRLIGIEITLAASAVPDATSGGPYVSRLLELGSDQTTDASRLPTDIVVDRSYIHGLPTKNVRRCVMLNSRRTSIVDSYLSDAHEIGADSQAIAGWNGPGPYKIVNNHLEAAGENVMFGGSDPKIAGLIPSDIEFRRNLLFKPPAWKTSQWSVKNLFELKNAQRVWIDGNTMDGIWPAGQQGFAVLLKSVNQDGSAPWSHTGDVTFTNNTIKNSFGGINLLGTDSSQPGVRMNRVLIRNNVFTVTGDYWLLVCEVADLLIDRNTAANSGSLMQAYGPPSQRFIYTGNVANSGPFGIKGDGLGPGVSTLNVHFPGFAMTGNVFFKGEGANYPPGNFYAATPNTGADLAAISAAQARP
jgi:hypothetical protein